MPIETEVGDGEARIAQPEPQFVERGAGRQVPVALVIHQDTPRIMKGPG
jgi:hypothetical protein